MILLSPTECLIFSGNHNQAMSWDESLRYAHQLSGIHPWTSYMIEVVALQQTLKEACHEMQVAREFTHERTKQRIAHLNALAMAPTAKAQPTMPQRSPRGHGMTRWADQFFVQQQLREMTIRPSQSPWCNAVVLLRKKDGSLQFCIDFHRLNAQTKKDTYPLPCMQETMESMVGARHFSCMDLKSGFWQVKMAEESRQYTAFTVGSMGMYEFLRMPYGLCNAPTMFQCLMQNCLGELNLMYAQIYLDDVIVYSKTEEEHLVCLRAILERFMEHGLKLKLSKCNFFRTEISYLGHKVSVAGMELGTEGLKGITEIVPPATYTQVHKFLGATGYFRHFIKGYARIAKPLNELLQGENSKLKSQLLGLPPDALAAFQELKMKCLTVPVLAFADFKKPSLLETDASIEGLGAVLSQKQDDIWYHPVAYAS